MPMLLLMCVVVGVGGVVDGAVVVDGDGGVVGVDAVVVVGDVVIVFVICVCVDWCCW